MAGSLVHGIVIISSGLLLSGCGMLIKDPEVSVNDIELTTLSLDSFTIDVTLCVDNKNPLGLTLKDLSFEISYRQDDGWVHLSQGEKSGIPVKPGRNEVTVPVIVKNSGLIKALLGMVLNGSITLQVTGTAIPDLLVLAPKIPFTKIMTIPLNSR